MYGNSHCHPRAGGGPVRDVVRGVKVGPRLHGDDRGRIGAQ